MQAYDLSGIVPGRPVVTRLVGPSDTKSTIVKEKPISLQNVRFYPQQGINNFLAYLRTMPFQYPGHLFGNAGRTLGSEADVRQFLDSSIFLPMWPVALDMLPEERDYVIFMSNEVMLNDTRPDYTFYTSKDNVQASFVLNLELKGPKALDGLQHLLGQTPLPIAARVAWDIVTKKVKKYAKTYECPVQLLVDDARGILFIFDDDAPDYEAGVSIVLADDGSPGGLTVRQLFLLAFYIGIQKTTPGPRPFPPEFAAVYHSHKEIKGAIPFNSPSIAQPTRQSGRNLSAVDAAAAGPSEVKMNLREHRMYPCRIAAADLPPNTLENSSILISRRRYLSPEVVSNKFYMSWCIQADRIAPNIFYAQTIFGDNHVSGPPSTPPEIPSELILKSYNAESHKLRTEAEVYNRLRSLQGWDLPFCYGILTEPGDANALLALEFLGGRTLAAMIPELSVDNERVLGIFAKCNAGLGRIHERGIAHCDVSPGNIIILANDDVVFIDFADSEIAPEPHLVHSDKNSLFAMFWDAFEIPIETLVDASH